MSAMCGCIRCSMCGGKGHYYIDLRGNYAGSSRTDDLMDQENCEECGGSGYSELCAACSDSLYAEDDL